jgi:hypothetical protein
MIKRSMTKRSMTELHRRLDRIETLLEQRPAQD